MIGPVFIESAVPANGYVELLQSTVVPEIDQNRDIECVVCQQNGVLPRFGRSVGAPLGERFPRWIVGAFDQFIGDQHLLFLRLVIFFSCGMQR